MLSEEQLQQLHALEYDALEQLDAFCRENGLTYFLRGGSALGAVKYGGIIPWDDDIDIALPRADYRRLTQVLPPMLGDYRTVSWQRGDRSHCYFPRVVLQESRREVLGLPRNHPDGTLLIDILPLDGIPDSPLRFRLQTLRSRWYRLLSSVWTLESPDTPCKRTGLKKFIPEFLHRIRFHRLYTQEQIFRRMDALYEKYEYGTTALGGIPAGSKGTAEVMPVRWWGKGRRKRFGSGVYPVPAAYDRYLKRLFGEGYMQEEPDRKTIEERSHFL